MNSILSDIAFETSYLFIIAGSIIALLFGLTLIFSPKLALKFNGKMNRHISIKRTKNKFKVRTEPSFYKNAKVSGTLLIFGSLFILYTLNQFNFYLLIPYLPKQLSPLTWEWLLQAGQVFFFISSAFILIFGIIVFIRPSLIKNFEIAANRWISTQPFFASMNKSIDFSNHLITHYPRIIGVVFSFFSLIVLFFLLPLL